jgi:hypothetical protein
MKEFYRNQSNFKCPWKKNHSDYFSGIACSSASLSYSQIFQLFVLLFVVKGVGRRVLKISKILKMRKIQIGNQHKSVYPKREGKAKPNSIAAI